MGLGEIQEKGGAAAVLVTSNHKPHTSHYDIGLSIRYLSVCLFHVKRELLVFPH